MYDLSDPAPNIRELEQFLLSKHSDTYVYRGQVTDYPLMIPSFWRAAVSDLKTERAFIEFNNKNAVVNDNSAKLFVILSATAYFLGLPIGSILFQQYFAHSQGLDFTRDPSVGCFFASRSFPKYNVVGKSKGCGVVYRARTPEQIQNPMLWAELSHQAAQNLGDGSIGVFALFLKDFEIEAANLDVSKIIRDFKLFNETRVFTIPMFLDFSALPSILSKISADPGIIRHPLQKDDPGRQNVTKLWAELLSMTYSSSRLASQSGCLLIPVFHFNALYPHTVSIREVKGPYKYLTPPIAIGMDTIGLENFRSFPLVEKFYFRHSDISSRIEQRSLLWPNSSDGLMDTLVRLLEEVGDLFGLKGEFVRRVLDYGYTE